MNEIVMHYDTLIKEKNDPVCDPEPMKRYMDQWDGADFIEAMNLTADMHVLELGIGTGRIALKVAPLCEKLDGIDLSPMTIECAQRNLGSMHNIQLYCGDFMDFLFPNNYDVIYSTLTFMHIEHKQDAINKAAGLLRQNGRFVLSIDKNQDEYIDMGNRRLKIYPDNPEEIRVSLERAGLNIERQFETGFAVIFAAVKGVPCN